MHYWKRRALLVFVLGLLFAGSANAQGVAYYTPSTIPPGGSSILTVSSSPGMTIDIQYTDPVYGPLEVDQWLQLDGGSQSPVFAASDQPLGDYIITAIRQYGADDWVSESAVLTVAVPVPTSLTFSPSTTDAGGTCKTMTFGNASNMTVDMLFRLSLNDPPTQELGWGPHALNSGGHPTDDICDGHYSIPQTLTVDAVENASFAGYSESWVSLSPPVAFTLLAPQPTSLSFSATTVNQGGAFAWTVGNGADATLDVKLKQTPTWDAVNYPDGEWIGYAAVVLNSSGQATMSEPSNQLLGTYQVHHIKNTLDADWVVVNQTVKVCPSAPTVTSTSTSSGTASSTTVDVSVTIGGRGFYCSVALSDVSGTGITFGVTDPSSPATSLSTTFHIASTASTGAHTIRLSAGGGHYDFGFTVNASNTPTVTGVSPNSGVRGTSGSVTITGTNLSGATLSGPSGVSWSITSTTSTSISAAYSVSCTATLGSGNITVSNNGHTATGSFTVNNVSTPTISSISPSSSGQGSTPSVTVSGTNLCGAGFSASGWSGLSFSGGSSSYTSASATFTITSGATVGSPTITVTNAASLTASTSFTILNTLSWSQDYIRDGNGVVIATARPVPSDTTVPTTPSGLTVTSYTSTSVTLSWTASTDSGGSGLAGYKIYRQTGSGPNLPVGAVGASTVTFTDVTLQSGHTYNYTVVAVDKAENYSTASGSVAQTTP